MMLSLACDHRTIDGATELNFTNIETIYRKPSYHACVIARLSYNPVLLINLTGFLLVHVPLPLALQCGQAIRYIFIPLHFIKGCRYYPSCKKVACTLT
jgi:hypothetical protein